MSLENLKQELEAAFSLKAKLLLKNKNVDDINEEIAEL